MNLVELWSEDELIDIAFRLRRARMIARTKTVLVYLLARRFSIIDTNNNNNG